MFVRRGVKDDIRRGASKHAQDPITVPHIRNHSLNATEATRSQDLASWVHAHVGMVEYFGGSTAIWVPDNLKSGVTAANYYEPAINRPYAELAHHYGAIVLPTRAAHPKDKGRGFILHLVRCVTQSFWFPLDTRPCGQTCRARARAESRRGSRLGH